MTDEAVQPASSLGDDGFRERISGPAFSAFIDAMRFLKLDPTEAQALLGGLAPETYQRYVEEGAPGLRPDQLERMSLVFGIVKALRILFVEDDAGVRWIHGANTDEPFHGKSPKDVMLQGSLTDLLNVRRYLDG